MSEKTLGKSIHHKGRLYGKGMTESQIGPIAKEFGDHVWEGSEASTPRTGVLSGTMLGSPIVPTPSGLPGGPTPTYGQRGAGEGPGEGGPDETGMGGPGDSTADTGSTAGNAPIIGDPGPIDPASVPLPGSTPPDGEAAEAGEQGPAPKKATAGARRGSSS